jgi:hypothetical protein
MDQTHRQGAGERERKQSFTLSFTTAASALAPRTQRLRTVGHTVCTQSSQATAARICMRNQLVGVLLLRGRDSRDGATESAAASYLLQRSG